METRPLQGRVLSEQGTAQHGPVTADDRCDPEPPGGRARACTWARPTRHLHCQGPGLRSCLFSCGCATTDGTSLAAKAHPAPPIL